MDDTRTLYEELTARLSTAEVPAAMGDLIAAAFQGEEILDALLRGEPLPAPPATAHTTGAMPHVFLESVQVTGFRGIGPTATIPLQPKTGLTIFMGRNGSGKSSIAEAVEHTLIEDVARWAQRPPAIRDGWRNLHHGGMPDIKLTMRLGTGAKVTIRRTWPADAGPSTATVTTTASGAAMQSGELSVWTAQVEQYRPFLSARDLERVITAKPAELYDAIAPILGLGQLVDADVRLLKQRKICDDRVKALKESFSDLREQLGILDDDRARQALHSLGAQPGKADLTDLADLAGGAAGATDARAAIAARRLGEEALPDGGRVLAALADATTAVRDVSGTDSAAADRIAALLQRALDVHRDEGDRLCPVCRTGRLDQSWRDGTEAELARLTAAATAARAARAKYATARREVDRTFGNVRGLLEPVADALAAQLPVPNEALREALAALTDEPASWRVVVAAHADLAAAAAEWLAHRNDTWREPGAAIRRWVDAATLVRAETPALSRLTKARAALAKASGEIRAERMGAFIAQSARMWQQLRQESNVDMRRLTMDGVNTSRRIVFPAAVDGVDTNALAVMSQGELHALGLSVFLPRACADASPYRFVVIDDPVQSMDPAKVDGLAEVLREVSLTRQVVLFTHDDRLPEAIRRLEVESTVWEVTRREGSIVEIRKASDPAERYLDDARAVVAADIPDEAKYLLVAGFCRSALEAVSMDRYRAAQNRAGTPYHDIQEALGGAYTVKDRLTLGLWGDVGHRGDLLRHLNQAYGRDAADAVQAVAAAVHGHQTMAIRPMVTHSTALVGRLR